LQAFHSPSKTLTKIQKLSPEDVGIADHVLMRTRQNGRKNGEKSILKRHEPEIGHICVANNIVLGICAAATN